MNRELSSHGARITSVETRLEALAGIPERMARLEATVTEKMDTISVLLKTLLVSVLVLIVESIRVWVKEARNRNGRRQQHE